ncbi:VCBS domain-containing protein [Variovorax sp. J22R133]|uniref:VCBS domain-containing protein n=1 Tax=Variovorax brevis TaxID=3053503 RepID=UPI00257748CC|nr:VCBS domain-containing protein [Variovorax sp. J22R133]MDM0114790.1 VCBS domain-containing protein [Variovorax sp. J22R133]
MFDGAAATAVDHHHDNDAGATAPAGPVDLAARAPATAAPAAAPTVQPPTLNLVVVDSRVENREQLTAKPPTDTKVLVVDTRTNGLAAISAALAELGHVDSIQIFSHGASGQFTLGNATLDRDALRDAATVLSSWHAQLNAGADIQLYGCDIGAGPAGQALVAQLAQLTGADVGASSDATGSTAAGGNWNLEVVSGVIDKPLAIGAEASAAYAGLLANAAPTVALDSGGSDVLLGEQASFTVNFSNNSAQVGYAPFIDVFLPATGKDGNDGVTFASATYLGQTLGANVVTFDANGNATHPFARDANGNPVIVTAASVGMRAGDLMVVISLPYGSVANDQPVIPVNVTVNLSNLADTAYSNGNPDLGIAVRGGFELGNDALFNPKQDPSLIGTGLVQYKVHPTVLTFDETINAPEGETATGPNYGRTLTVTATPALGQTLTHVEVVQDLPITIQVTAITPGAGGTLTSIRLHSGTVLTDPNDIARAIAAGDFIDSFTVTYASLSVATNTVVAFYVPDADAEAAAILDPKTGNPRTITVAAAQARGGWVPLDPRDLTPPATSIDFTASGEDTSFVARSIALIKQATLQTETGHAGLTPGDTLAYQFDITISDFFVFGRNILQEGQFVVKDQLTDGQTLAGTPTLSFSIGGATQTIALVATPVVNPDGSTSLTFDIAQSLRNNDPLRAYLNGDLAMDSSQLGATRARISYTATIGQSYKPPAGAPHSDINEGDSVGNNAVVTATILDAPASVAGNQSDGSGTTSTVPTSTIDIQLVSVNNGTPPANGELRPGDLVTFQLSYDLVTGDYESFSLRAYLPLPLFSVAGIAWSNGDEAGQWELDTGNTNPGPPPTVSSGAGNSVVFTFPDYATPANGSRIVVAFTLRVGDQPFADQRSLSVLGQSRQLTTLTDQQLISYDVTRIASIAEPVLNITHGVVSTTHGTVTGTTGSWSAPGTSGVPFTGSVNSLAAIDGSVSGIDAGDTVRMATAIENTGGGNAFDVATSIALPAGIGFVGGSLATANVLVFRGDGSQLVLGTDYAVSGNAITFLDAGNQGSLLAGRPGSAADTAGRNLVVITYDTVVAQSIEASRTLQSTGTLNRYASAEGGTDFTPTDLSDIAAQQVAAPSVTKSYADGSLDNGDSSATHTSGSNLVIGESMLYDIVVTLPEGVAPSLVLTDLVPTGLRLDMSFNNGTGYQLLTSNVQTGSLPASLNGTVVISGVSAVSGVLGDDGVDPRFTFSSAQVTGDNVLNNNSFVIRLRLVASNTLANQAGQTRTNSAQLSYSDLDGDTANGSTAITRNVALSGGAPGITVREPTLQIAQTLVTPPGLGFDEGDVVQWDITITNGTGATDFDAFDISFLNPLPTQLSNIALTGVVYGAGATNHGGPDFVLSGTSLATALTANIDVARGGTITLHLSGVINATAAAVPAIPNSATVQWTSLDGTVGGAADPAGERTGVNGALNSGVLNDYRLTTTLNIPVASGMRFSRVGGLDNTIAPTPTDNPVENVTVGEIIRYRAAVLMPEGVTPNYQLQITLDAGLDFIVPTDVLNNIRVGLVSNGPQSAWMTSDATLTINLTPVHVDGNENSPEAQLITPTLTGPAPLGVFDPTRITVTTNAQGRQVITFNLGTITNPPNDLDLEGIVIEFNVRVANVAAVRTGAQLNATVHEFSNGVQLGGTETLTESIVEPSFNSLLNRVIDFDPNPSGNSGTATFQVDFTQNGGVAAFNTRLAVNYPRAINYQLVSIKVDGNTYTPGNLPPGISTFIGPSGVAIDFDQINIGSSVQVVYTAILLNDEAVLPVNTILTWTSLPETFTEWGGDIVGSDGQRDGERIGTGIGPNGYLLRTAAGLGRVAGVLWNDTFSANSTPAPALTEPLLQGKTVTLTWGGVDNDLLTTADNRTFTTITDLAGAYHFTLLPTGVYRITMPTGPITDINDAAAGLMDVRIDTDAGTLGQVDFAIDASTPEGVVTVIANAGYVEHNDPPTFAVPGTQNGLEDVPLAIHGIVVADPDAQRNPNPASPLTVRLNVGQGTLSLSGVPTGVTVSGSGTGTLFLTGALADLNAALDMLLYQGRRDYNGNDRLFLVVSDNGNFGDANNRNGIPGEAQDALSASADFLIVLAPVNDPPVAVDDNANAREAGGTDNQQPGFDPPGGLLGKDVDPDLNDIPPDVLRVTEIGLADQARQPVPPTGLREIVGQYGRLVVDRNGLFQYIVDNSNAAVEALRTPDQTLQESFDYVVSDIAGATDIGRLTVTIHGANDTPIPVDDEGTAVEAGGVANNIPGSDATGNVLTDPLTGDHDKDVVGEALTVTGIRLIPESNPGPILPVPGSTGGGSGLVVTGLYGTLTIGSNGSYRYVVDNNNAAVQALSNDNQILSEVFSYRVTDVGALDALANLTIIIRGRNDNPVATDNAAQAQAAPSDLSRPEINPGGNVITDNNGNGVDSDIDRADQPSTVLQVNGIRTGTEAAGGALGAVAAGSSSASGGTVLQGLYGTLTIGANGSYAYDVDSTNPLVYALPEGGSLNDVFTYRLADTGGLTDLAQLVVQVKGVNDPPVAGDVNELAIEAGGFNNQSAGVDPISDVRGPALDPDGNVITLTFVRPGRPNVPGTDQPVSPTGETVIRGTYGTLFVAAIGAFEYRVDNLDPAVQALLLDTDRIQEYFTYTVDDGQGLSAKGELVVVIHGRNDNPVGVNDTIQATEAGGTRNGTAGIDPVSNVLVNDTDVDTNDQRFVLGARSGGETRGGPLTGVPLNGSVTIAGTYGSLVISYDGSYQYVVDNGNPAVDALRPGQTLSESFTYALKDLAGAADSAQLDVTINGAWDAPVARDNATYAVANNPFRTAINPEGNLLTDDNFLGVIVFGADSDVDNSDVLHVSAVRAGPETDGPGGMTAVPAGSTLASGVRITGQYGWLNVGADGGYLYEVDSLNPAILALGPLGFVTERFTYAAQDLGGLTDLAQLTVVIRGVNQAPIAVPDQGDAIEAGGLHNVDTQPSPNGNALANDTDVEGDQRFVVGVRPGDSSAGAAVGGLGTTVQGLYGTLTMQRDGAWEYVVNDDLPAVEALRISGQTLTDVFTYTITDFPWGARATSELRVVIDGRNDTPIAADDTATAVEAGGIANATPGVDPRGNVLDNDSDVDSAANGETRQVLSFAGSDGKSATAGSALQGLYGRLVLNADGSYTYDVDNDNPVVQALRLAGETLTERFSYFMRDTAGATSRANFIITIQGANDNPVALDDTTDASDQVAAPQTTGNVLPNDSDVDGGDARTVVAIRAGAGNGTGAAGSLGQPLSGRYGTLEINADGSYTYTIDQSNPDVLAAAGRGQVLNDYFTYTVADLRGATDQAQLTVLLDIAAPFVPAPGDQIFPQRDRSIFQNEPLPQLQPAIFVQPVVRDIARGLEFSSWRSDGTRVLAPLADDFGFPSIGAGLGRVNGQFVARAVAEGRVDRELSMARLLGREGRVNLSADGLLDAPSLFAPEPEMIIPGEGGSANVDPEALQPQTARSFTEQLRGEAQDRAAFSMESWMPPANLAQGWGDVDSASSVGPAPP